MAHGGYTTRKAAFKQIDSAIGNLETYLYHMLQVKNDYSNDHPEIAEAANDLMLYVLKVQQITEAFRKSF